MTQMNNNLLIGEELCDFVWQYEQRKRWNNFSDDEIQHLNETLKQGSHFTSLTTKKRWKQATVDFDAMIQKYDTCFYEQRIRCVIYNSGFYVWLWKNEYDEWISYNPQLAFLLEVGYQRKEKKISLSNIEINLESFEEINTVTGDLWPVKRECVTIISNESIQAIVKKNEHLLRKACAADNLRFKRYCETFLDSPNIGARKKKCKDVLPNVDIEKNSALSLSANSKMENYLNSSSENEQSLSLIHKNIPVDDECSEKANFHIYIEGKTIFSATLNLTSLQNNNNKFYIIQLLEHANKKQYCVWRRWGRVGHRGQTNLNKYGTSLSEAKGEFEGKFYDKTRNNWSEVNNFVHVPGKYDYLKMDLNSKAEVKKVVRDVKSRLPDALKALMELICDTQRMEDIMREMSYDSNRTPLGTLTVDQVKSGYEALQKIVSVIQKRGSHSELLNACNDFYTKIPHNFGMKTPPLIKTQEDIDQKLRMLEALSNITVAMDMMNTKSKSIEHPLDRYYNSLNCSLELLTPDCLEYMEIEKFLQYTHGPTHNTYKMEIINIFKCFKPYEESSFINYDNNFLLWHGSRIINWLGILKNGLKIAPPEAPSTGYMFGKGVYFADVSSKSANYCFATKRKNEGLLLLCEVSVGNQYPLLEADESMPVNLPREYNSVFGKGKVTPSDFQPGVLSSDAKVPVGPLKENPKHTGSLLYNEYIVYDTKQIKMKYLIRLKFNFK